MPCEQQQFDTEQYQKASRFQNRQLIHCLCECAAYGFHSCYVHIAMPTAKMKLHTFLLHAARSGTISAEVQQQHGILSKTDLAGRRTRGPEGFVRQQRVYYINTFSGY